MGDMADWLNENMEIPSDGSDEWMCPDCGIVLVGTTEHECKIAERSKGMTTTKIAIVFEAQTDGEYCGDKCMLSDFDYQMEWVCKLFNNWPKLDKQGDKFRRCQACLDGEQRAKELGE